VRDPALRAETVIGVAWEAARRGWGVAGVTPSSLPGPSGNVEFFLWLRRDALRNDRSVDETQIAEVVERAQGRVEH
jgi:23S rRNA (cytidine1920-2'-O)/16S rRNA (cytidine1409-2'-O)-methyltransferase